MSSNTAPEVFIIESLSRDDEEQDRYEGHRLSDMLTLSDKTCRYVYIRTVLELEEVIKEFSQSNYRYLHLSCHGANDCMALTYEHLDFPNLGKLLRPVLKGRRLFVSACSMVNWALADEVMKNSGCVSIMGSPRDIDMGDAALFWASLYHLMFRENANSMRNRTIKDQAAKVSAAFDLQFSIFTARREGTRRKVSRWRTTADGRCVEVGKFRKVTL